MMRHPTIFLKTEQHKVTNKQHGSYSNHSLQRTTMSYQHSDFILDNKRIIYQKSETSNDNVSLLATVIS